MSTISPTITSPVTISEKLSQTKIWTSVQTTAQKVASLVKDFFVEVMKYVTKKYQEISDAIHTRFSTKQPVIVEEDKPLPKDLEMEFLTDGIEIEDAEEDIIVKEPKKDWVTLSHTTKIAAALALIAVGAAIAIHQTSLIDKLFSALHSTQNQAV